MLVIILLYDMWESDHLAAGKPCRVVCFTVLILRGSTDVGSQVLGYAYGTALVGTSEVLPGGPGSTQPPAPLPTDRDKGLKSYGLSGRLYTAPYRMYVRDTQLQLAAARSTCTKYARTVQLYDRR